VTTFLDNYSSYCNIAFLHKISEAVEAIKSIFQMWSNSTSHAVKRLQTDNYVMSALQSFLREQGIIHETSIPYVHQQNGHAE